jgi:hypothetical protein
VLRLIAQAYRGAFYLGGTLVWVALKLLVLFWAFFGRKDYTSPYPVKMLNCYGPYKDMALFWQRSKQSGCLADDSIIIGGGGGDLNLTLSVEEIWGERAILDPLADFFSVFFSSADLVDTFPSPLSPTWRNGGQDPYGISKRLDRFLLNGRLLGDEFRSRSWVINSIISDHNPVCL